MKAAAALAAVVLAVACAAPTPPPAVPVRGEPADLSALAGEWTGEYSSAGTGRSGAIRMTIEAGTNIAHGDVLMFPARAEERPQAANADPAGAAPQALAIRFVAIADGLVSGTLEPYRDPQCNCILSTTFTGRVQGDTIEGTFISHGGRAHTIQEGRWRVDRKRG
jgi:hypothetical protein